MEKVDPSKAVAIPQRYTKMCDICMLIDTEGTKDTKWFVYREGIVIDEDSYVCGKCLDTIKDIRKKCHQKIDNPKHQIFDKWMPWFAEDIPGLKKAMQEQMI